MYVFPISERSGACAPRTLVRYMDHWNGDHRDDNVPIEWGDMGGMARRVTGRSFFVGALGIATASITASPPLVTKAYCSRETLSISTVLMRRRSTRAAVLANPCGPSLEGMRLALANGSYFLTPNRRGRRSAMESFLLRLVDRRCRIGHGSRHSATGCLT